METTGYFIKELDSFIQLLNKNDYVVNLSRQVSNGQGVEGVFDIGERILNVIVGSRLQKILN